MTLHNACKCGIEDVPLILGNLTKVGVCVLRSLEMHWGNTKATSVAIASEQVPSGQYWSKQMVTEKIDMVDDPACHHTLLQVYQSLMQKEDSSYAKFIHMHIIGYHCPFLYEIFSTRNFHGIECALWPSLYHTTVMGESVLEGQTN